MTRSTRWLVWLLSCSLAAGLLLLLASAFFTGFLIDSWWFDALVHGLYFWQRLVYKYALFIVVTGSFFSLSWVNFWIAVKHLGKGPAGGTPTVKSDVADGQQSLIRFQRLTRRFYVPLSFVLAIIVALPLYFQ